MTASQWCEQFCVTRLRHSGFTSQKYLIQKTDVSVAIQLPSSMHKTVKHPRASLSTKHHIQMVGGKGWEKGAGNGGKNYAGVTMSSSTGGHRWEGGSPCLC